MERPSFPAVGQALASVTEERARPIRQAVAVIQDVFAREQISREFLALFMPKWTAVESVELDASHPTRAAWAIVAIWTVSRLCGAIGPLASLADAEAWFFGDSRNELPSLASKLDRKTWLKAFWLLEEIKYDFALADLLPYVLDVHGPGSRLSVMKDASTARARAAKRESGVFYTPADVAEYMARKALDDLADLRPIRCFDPACGSGVFLRALLNVAAERGGDCFDRLAFATESLYAVDLDPFAVDAACFVLLHDCLGDVRKRGIAPWEAWHALRLNFAVIDALHVAPASSRSCERAEVRAKTQQGLLSGDFGQPAGSDSRNERHDVAQESWFGVAKDERPVNNLFPEVTDGFDILVGNPPYAAIGQRRDAAFLERRYASLRGKLSPRDDLYPLFIETMWQLTRPQRSSSALVVPLSIAYHRGTQFQACRRKMVRQGGRWQFAFFDREPHALFGEDVKTRNAILFRRESDQDPPRGETAVVETGPLRKWTSRSRQRLFRSISFACLKMGDISAFIPKLDGASQAQAAALLLERSHSLARLWSQARSCLPSEAFREPKAPTVFVAGTAYNFLNVFRPHERRPPQRFPLSESPLLRLQFSDESVAQVAFAILSSRVSYWLWQVQCDGFHVPRWFVESIPFSRESFTEGQRQRLCDWAGQLWKGLQEHQIVSLNGGRETIAYRPLACEKERDEIDKVLIEAAGLDASFADELRQIIRSTVIVDETDARRRTVQAHFQRTESIP